MNPQNLLSVLTACLLTFQLHAQADRTASTSELADPVKVTTVEGITEYRLENGLRFLLFPDPTKQTITVNITYLVGSKHENYGETGMAHLLEHLVFKGTPKHPNIPQELTERGARPNGTTWTDRTNYFETFSATEDNLRWALDLESDRMINSFISKDDLDSEMTVVRNEFEAGENSPWRVLWQRMMATAFEWHNYGKSTIGARSDIENVPIDRLQAFYKTYYQPDNAVLVVAGNIDEEKTVALVNEYFGPIPRPERELTKFYTRDPDQDGERMVTVRRVGDTQFVGVGYKTPAASHEDAAAVDVLRQILGDTPSGRLYKALVDTKLASTTFAYNFQWKDPGILLAFAEMSKEHALDDARAAMLQAFDELQENPPTDEEIERAKTAILKQIELSFNSSERIGLQLSEYIGSGDWRLLFINRDRIRDVTKEDIQRAVAQYIKRDNRTIGMFVPVEKPDRTKIPDPVDINLLVDNYKGGEGIAMGEAFDPSPDNINQLTETGSLQNGMQLALLPKKTRGKSVNFNITLRFGDEENLMHQGRAGEYVAQLLNRGTSTKTREEIKDSFDRLKANVNFYGGASSLTVTGETVHENLPEVLQLVKEVLHDPVFPENEFEKLVSENVTRIESQMSEPTAIASRRMSIYTNPYPKGDPRYAETFEESLEGHRNVKLEDVKAFYKKFYGANHGTLAIVGDFDEGKIKPLLTDMFGNWNSPSSYSRLVGKIKAVEILHEQMETPDKANAFFLALQQMPLIDTHEDYPALVLGNFMLGGGFLNSRLATRIRQKDGLSYGVGSGFNASSLDTIGTFQAYAIYAPENAEKLEQAFREEMEKALNEGFTDEEVAAAKSGWLQTRSVNRSQDNYLSSVLNNYLFLKRDMGWEKGLEEKVNALTAAEINQAMKKHIHLDKISMIKAGDFAKLQAAEK
ncbi:M16 family metallopeptidase [Negadavirga shengliensis]|uniref:M16 family metallopeptidase n=1 Tax=Negadavirga shengliensis TaxID=1389218 RepID=A0ABV9T1H8_9BACT